MLSISKTFNGTCCAKEEICQCHLLSIQDVLVDKKIIMCFIQFGVRLPCAMGALDCTFFHLQDRCGPLSHPSYSAISHFHIVSLSHIWDRALPCAGWCDPQIDSFIHNDKRWVWTGLLIWQSLKCHCDGCWRDPASLATHRIAIAPSSDPTLFIFPGGSRSCLFKKETSNWIKMARSPKTEARAP